jgi:hypothetical protein
LEGGQENVAQKRRQPPQAYWEGEKLLPSGLSWVRLRGRPGFLLGDERSALIALACDNYAEKFSAHNVCRQMPRDANNLTGYYCNAHGRDDYPRRVVPAQRGEHAVRYGPVALAAALGTDWAARAKLIEFRALGGRVPPWPAPNLQSSAGQARRTDSICLPT